MKKGCIFAMCTFPQSKKQIPKTHALNNLHLGSINWVFRFDCVLETQASWPLTCKSTLPVLVALHLTCHHPIHAQNFTIRSHSTAQVPCSCLASTYSDVSSRPPCDEFFVMEGHNPQFHSFNRIFVPDVSTRPGGPFFKNWPDVTTRPPFFVA